MSLGKKVAEARKSKNLTQEQLAELMAVTRQSVSRWESDLAYPEMDKVVLLSEILDVSCDYLLKDGKVNAETNSNGSVTRLLRQVQGKKIKIEFYKDAQDTELSQTVCQINEFDGQWVHITYQKKKKDKTKLIPASSILSITILESGEME